MPVQGQMEQALQQELPSRVHQTFLEVQQLAKPSTWMKRTSAGLRTTTRIVAMQATAIASRTLSSRCLPGSNCTAHWLPSSSTVDTRGRLSAARRAKDRERKSPLRLRVAMIKRQLMREIATQVTKRSQSNMMTSFTT